MAINKYVLSSKEVTLCKPLFFSTQSFNLALLTNVLTDVLTDVSVIYLHPRHLPTSVSPRVFTLPL